MVKKIFGWKTVARILASLSLVFWGFVYFGGAAASAATALPKSPAGRISVLTANAGELLNGADIKETIDEGHLAGRIQAVLNALNSRSPDVPNYAPDVVLLQEVTHDSTSTIASKLSAATGYTYKVGADALPGTAAWEDSESSPRITRDTAILYNSSTMTTASSSAASLLTYPESAIATGQPATTWVSMRASTVELRQLSSSKLYGVYSVHYRPDTFVANDDSYVQNWTNFLKVRVAQIYPGATPVIGGDLNNHSNAFAGPFRTNTSAGPGVYSLAQPEGTSSEDVVASTAPLLTSNYDYDYKTYGTNQPTYFDNVNTFLRCDSVYNVGGGGDLSQTQAINGCSQRYYSDHAFVWAVFGG